MANALASLDAEFSALYIDFGRPSIAPERLIRASLIQILFSIRSERQLMDQMQYNLVFRWFVGLGIDDLRQACVTPHVAQKSRYSAIGGRTTRHEGYALSIKHRKRIDSRRENDPLDRFLILLAFGWAKTVGGLAQTVCRGAERVRSRFILTMAANNLARLPRLLNA